MSNEDQQFKAVQARNLKHALKNKIVRKYIDRQIQGVGGGQKKVDSIIIDSKKSASNENQLFKSPQTMKSGLINQPSLKHSIKHQIACGPAGPGAAVD